MRADQIMTQNVITIRPEGTIADAAKMMLQHHISGLPVVDEAGALRGIISEGRFSPPEWRLGPKETRPLVTDPCWSGQGRIGVRP